MGRLTLGENIVDLDGLEIAYQEFFHLKQAPYIILIDGWTSKQRFLLAFARTCRVKITNGIILSSTKQDPHVPAETRMNGTIIKYDGFLSDAMFRESEYRVHI